MRFLMVIVCIGVIVYSVYSFRQDVTGSVIEKQTSDFAVSVVISIANGWDPAVYKQYADVTPESEKLIEAAFLSYSRLGKLVRTPLCEIKDFSTQSQRKTQYSFAGKQGYYADAKYECQAEFTTGGPATIELTVYAQDSNTWRIRYFNIISDFFTRPAPPTP